MRVSTYELIYHFPNYNRTILFNGLCGSLDIVPIEVGKKLEDAMHSGQFENDFMSADLKVTLERRFHITELSETSEIEYCRKVANTYEKIQKPLYAAHRFIILPTYSCNFCCPYCYERDIDQHNSGDSSISIISKEQVDNIFSIMSKYPFIKEKSQMEIFGGEPLFEETFPIVKYIVQKAEAAGRNITVTTNGYDLDLFKDLLGPTKIAALQITVDGPEEVHNKRRIARKGGGTFKKIMSNIKLALEKNVKVRVRVNIDKSNLNSYIELLEYFNDNGFFAYPNFIFTFALVKILPNQKNELCITDAEFYHYIETNIQDEVLLKYAIAEENGGLLNNLINNPVATSKTRYCGAVGSSVFFAPDGLVYNCAEAVGQPQYAVGTYDKQLHIDLDKEAIWKNRNMPNIPECLKCPLIFMCAGGCAYRAIDAGHPQKPYCDSIRESFEGRLRIETKMYKVFEPQHEVPDPK